MNDVRILVDEQVPSLRWLVLDRPEARNAYSEAMVDGICAALDELEEDDAVRVVALIGTGSAFSAGGDLKLMAEHAGMFEGGPVQLRSRYLRGIQRVPRRIHRFDKPLIAAVNGHAIGAGLDLACMADIRVVARGAKLGSTFVKVGLVPGDGGATFLTRTIGYPRALEMILTGRLVGADEALALGLAHAVCERDELEDAVRMRAAQLAKLPPLSVRLTKSAVVQSWDLTVDQSLSLAATLQGISQNSADHDEAVASFLEKRDPEFTGK